MDMDGEEVKRSIEWEKRCKDAEAQAAYWRRGYTEAVRYNAAREETLLKHIAELKSGLRDTEQEDVNEIVAHWKRHEMNHCKICYYPLTEDRDDLTSSLCIDCITHTEKQAAFSFFYGALDQAVVTVYDDGTISVDCDGMRSLSLTLRDLRTLVGRIDRWMSLRHHG